MQSEKMRAAIAQGEELEKPGWVRLNLSALLTDSKANYIIEAVGKLALEAAYYEKYYTVDSATAQFTPVATAEKSLAI